MKLRERVRELSRIKSITNFSNRKIAKIIGCGHQTIGRDLALLKSRELDFEQVMRLDDDELTIRLVPGAPLAMNNKRLPDFAEWVTTLTKKHQTIRNLWFAYYLEAPEISYELSTIYQKFKDYCKDKKLETLLEHRPGEEAQFDYCGQTVPLTPLGTKTSKPVYVFIGTLCHSKYFLAYATYGQTTNDWLFGQQAFFEYIGGVPKVGIPDNPKAVVTKPRPNLQLNPIYAAFAEHYGFVIMPTRPGEPRDKAIVEGTVKFVTERILINMQSKIFRTLNEINAYLKRECDKLNALQFQKRSTSRYELFNLSDKPNLNPLPEKPFKRIEHAFTCTVPSNYRIVHEEHCYSVPWRWANKKADVVITHDEISISYAHKPPIVHKRSFVKGKETVVKSHLHPKHEAMVLLPLSEFIDWAEDYGERTKQFITKLCE